MKLAVLFLFLCTQALATGNPAVVMETSMGAVEIELYAEKSPVTVKNFLKYVDEKFYDGMIFHRVINNFMIQGGGFKSGLVEQKPGAPIKNEADNMLKNETGTIAMARTSAPHTASSQFFINVSDNASLDHVPGNPLRFGYAVFGKVTSGMHVVNRIKAVRTGSLGGHQDVPMDEVLIKSIRRK